MKLKINNQVYEVEKNEIQEQFVEKGIEKLNESDFSGKKGMFDSLIGSALMMAGVKKPKEYQKMNNMEFAVRLISEVMFSQLEEQTIEVHAKEVE